MEGEGQGEGGRNIIIFSYSLIINFATIPMVIILCVLGTNVNKPMNR